MSSKNVDDISPIGEMVHSTKLELFSLRGLVDISPFSHLINLTSLHIRGCRSLTHIPTLNKINSRSLDLNGYKELTDYEEEE